MKKTFVFLAVVCLLALSSCTTAYQTASKRDVIAPIVGASYADLDVSNQKITYTLRPTKKVRKGGMKNCVNTAIAEALKANGNGDVLVQTQEAVVTRTGLFFSRVKSVTVTGYPATYKNFQPVNKATVEEAFVNGTLTAPQKENVSFRLFKKF